MELISDANPYPHELPPLPIEPVRRRLPEAEPRHRAPSRRIPLPSLGRGAGALMLGVSSLIAVAIAAVAITQLSPRHHEASPGGPGASALLAKLAVLRRPQSAGDVLPRHLHLGHRIGSIIPRLTRLVYASSGTRMFLVAVKPAADGPLWGPRFGDQVAIVAVAGDQTAETLPIPAAELSDADEVGFVNPSDDPVDAFSVAVVPDGVARVRWSFDGNQGSARTVGVSARDNVAILPQNTGLLTRAVWYDTHGDVIPTSDAAFVNALDRRDATEAAPIIRYFERHPQPRPAVTSDFAIFSVTSARGVQTAGGDLISAPPLTKLPLAVLRLTYNGGRRFIGRPDMADVRHVLTPTGTNVYVIPGTFGLCTYTTDTFRLPEEGEGGGGGCTSDTAQAVAKGIGFSHGSFGGVTTTFRLLPKSIRTITIRGNNGTRRTIQPPYGIYIRER
jgi:hypothetical protein